MMRFLSFLLCFLFFASGTAQAQSQNPLADASEEASPYRSVLESMAIPFYTPQYTEKERIPTYLVPPSEEFQASTSLHEKTLTYEFELRDAISALQIELKIAPDFRSDNPFTFRFTLFSPDGTEESYELLPSFKVHDLQQGRYRFSVTGSGFSTYDIALKPLSFSLPEENKGSLLIEPNNDYSKEEKDILIQALDEGISAIIVSNSFAEEAYDLVFSPTTISRPLTVKEMALQLSSFENQTIDLLHQRSVPNSCADFSYFEMEEGALLTRWYCRKGDRLQTLSFISKDLLSLSQIHSDVFLSLKPYLQKPEPFSTFVSPEQQTPSLNQMKKSPVPYATALLILDGIMVFLLFFLLSPSWFRHLFHSKRLSDEMTLTEGLKRLSTSLFSLREKARATPLLSLTLFSMGLFFLFLLFELPWTTLFIRLKNDHSGLIYLTIFLLLMLSFVGFLFPEHGKELKEKIKVFHKNHSLFLRPTHYRALLLGFTLFCTLFLYDFFLFQKITLLLLIFLLACGGVVLFSTPESRRDLRRFETYFVRLNQALMMGLPLVVLFSSFHPSTIPGIEFSEKPIKAVEAKGSALTLPPLLDTSRESLAWVLPEKILLLHSGFSLHGPQRLFKRTTQFQLEMKVRSNVPLGTKTSNGSFQALFIPSPENLSLLHPFDSVGVYRLTTSPSIPSNRIQKARTWMDLLRTGPTQNSIVGIKLDQHGFNANDFLSVRNPVKNDSPLSLDLAPFLIVKNETSTFYTYHSQDSLSLQFDFESVSSKTKGQFFLMDAQNNVIEEKIFSLSPRDARLQVNYPAIPKGLYRFYFNFNTPLTLSHLTVNSGYLVLKTSHLERNARAPLSFYFKPYAASFSYSSDSGKSFQSAGGLIQTHDAGGFTEWDSFLEASIPSDLAMLSFPSETGALASSIDTLYSFTEKSWFNPFKFYFSDVADHVQYWVIENYTIPESLEDGWRKTQNTLELSPIKGEVSFDIQLESTLSNAWVLLDTLSLKPL